MTAEIWSCLGRRESKLFGKPKSEFVELSDVARQRVRDSSIQDFNYIRVIARGEFGRVYLVSEKDTGLFFAMKEVDKKNEQAMRKDCERDTEQNVMTEAKCPWIVEFLSSYHLPSKSCLLMEFVPGKTLLEVVQAKSKLPVRQVRIYAAEMLACLYSLHSHGYIHRDIKLGNFLLDTYGHLKLCDFSICVRFIPRYVSRKVFPSSLNFWEEPPVSIAQRRKVLVKNQRLFTVARGTWLYCAPEVIRLTRPERCSVQCSGYSFLCDFWSYGVCIYYLLYGRPPFKSHTKTKLPHLIIHWQETLHVKSKSTIPDTAVDLIKRLLCEEGSRLGAGGFHEVARHSFFAPVRWEGLGYRRTPDQNRGPDILEYQDSEHDLPSDCCFCLAGLCAGLGVNSTRCPLERKTDQQGQPTRDEETARETTSLSGWDSSAMEASSQSGMHMPSVHDSLAQSERCELLDVPIIISRSGSTVDEVHGSLTDPPGWSSARSQLSLAVSQPAWRSPSVSLRAASLGSLSNIPASPPPRSPPSGASSVTASTYVTAPSSPRAMTP